MMWSVGIWQSFGKCEVACGLSFSCPRMSRLLKLLFFVLSLVVQKTVVNTIVLKSFLCLFLNSDICQTATEGPLEFCRGM